MTTTDNTMTRADLIAQAWMQNKLALSDLSKIIPPDPETMIGLAHIWEHLNLVDDLLEEALLDRALHDAGDGKDEDEVSDGPDDRFDRMSDWDRDDDEVLDREEHADFDPSDFDDDSYDE